VKSTGIVNDTVIWLGVNMNISHSSPLLVSQKKTHPSVVCCFW